MSNVKDFFVATLQSALDLGIATPDDVIKHATAEVLAAHLPRPLWARLLTACIGAPRVDAQLIVDTVGVANLCEHVPSTILWPCIAEVAARALGGAVPAAKPAVRAQTSPPIAAPPGTRASSALPIATPPPPIEKPASTPAASPPVRGPNIPSFTTGATSTVVAAAPPSPEEDEAHSTVNRPRTATGGQRFRTSNTGIGRLASTSRRPQAAAEPPPPPTPPSRRAVTEGETAFDVETEVGREDWKSALAVDVDDDQLVDWTATEERSGEDVTRKR